MKREAFLAQPEVESFINWLAKDLPTRRFKLRFKPSKFVPGGLGAEIEGIESVLQHYRWRASWLNANQNPVDSQDWKSTQRSLTQLREWLSSAVASGDDQQALKACLQVLRWGGVRGAIPFLQRMSDAGQLAAYLQTIQPLMALDTDTSLECLGANVKRFDSGLTKIHALLDKTGSPIYDSRVGAAIAMLYALFRQESTTSRRPTLAFASGPARGTQIRNPGQFAGLAAARQFSTIPYAEWARCQLRLGWIVRSLLERTQWFADQGDMPARCHAFEASLFTLGYDLRCFDLSLALGANLPEPHLIDEPYSEEAAATGWVPSGHPFTQILKDYISFRRQTGKDGRHAFVDWLADGSREGKALSRATAQSYCFPFGTNEFDLFERPLNQLERIAAGGEGGLLAALGTDHLELFVEGDERVDVCLMDVFITGRAYTGAHTEEDRIGYIVARSYAGTANAARTLMSVGRNVGKHFGLLDANNLPTALFGFFYQECTTDV